MVHYTPFTVTWTHMHICTQVCKTQLLACLSWAQRHNIISKTHFDYLSGHEQNIFFYSRYSKKHPAQVQEVGTDRIRLDVCILQVSRQSHDSMYFVYCICLASDFPNQHKQTNQSSHLRGHHLSNVHLCWRKDGRFYQATAVRPGAYLKREVTVNMSQYEM